VIVFENNGGPVFLRAPQFKLALFKGLLAFFT